ncbi:putative toxin-antitoxin system toxin component, PIN family [Rudanella paleaurantiibacter]|uniref:putative toxin-antitoxin system toxin component, PIN family n=1 Tax=Rudanella paleaurantiibacter TaxID=2614655 RepID=UPI00162A248E|nr:putative toxin-antitoxin system toxin component, PIN family [Rudanella paleaurantiibacter]
MTKKRKVRLVIDANWFISACISRGSRQTLYYRILKDPRLQVFYSTELLSEFDGVIMRPKFAKLIKQDQVNRFKTITLSFLKKTNPINSPEIVRDPNDNYLLGICTGCKADFLVTGDKDLLSLETYQSTTIVTMGQFLSLLTLL